MIRSSQYWRALWALALSLGLLPAALAQEAVAIPAPLKDRPKVAAPMQSIVLAGGCFWGTQGLFQHVRGVKKVVAGYAGGDAEHATYAWVSSGETRHAEAVQVSFDPAVISLGELLQIFFAVAHDPTQVNQQWPDTGPQYRSAIFYADATQQQLAADYIDQLSVAGVFRRPIATRLEPLSVFYPAEAHHQDYLLRYPRAAYIMLYDLPKLRDLQRVWPERYRERAIDSNGVEQVLEQ